MSLRILTYLNSLKPVIGELAKIDPDAVFIVNNQFMSEQIASVISKLSCACIVTYAGAKSTENTTEKVTPPLINIEFSVAVWAPAFIPGLADVPVIDIAETIISGLHGYLAPGQGSGGTLVPRYIDNEVEIIKGEHGRDEYYVDRINFRARLQLMPVTLTQAD